MALVELWWCMPLVLALGSTGRQIDLFEFETKQVPRQDNTKKPCLRKGRKEGDNGFEHARKLFYHLTMPPALLL